MDLLDLEYLEEDLFRSCLTFERPYRLYGGQVAAQALCAAGRTVPAGRLPHSLHGYFLRSGSTTRPTVFRVDRDRDGGSFSARRVVAIQDGAVIFNMAASFAEPADGIERDGAPPPRVRSPGTLIPPFNPYRLSLEMRSAGAEQPAGRPPARFWIRCTADLPESPLLHACVLTYMSDLSSGMLPLAGEAVTIGPSLDHAVWFHRPARADDWLLFALVPQLAAGGRSLYTGAAYRADGTRAASVAQEALFAEKSDSR